MIIRGTTPIHVFKIPIDSYLIKDLRITYAQNDVELFTKGVDDCALEGRYVSVKLTQDDTFALKVGLNVQIQIRLLTIEDELITSSVYVENLLDCLNKEVI